jgi:hypothetical protein
LCVGEIMARGKSQDRSMLAMALIGYEFEKKKIEERIRDIKAQLGGRRVTSKADGASNADQPKRRKLSAAARKRIAAAQKKRWAEHRKAAAQAAKT